MKQLQWQEKLGEDTFVILLGTEMMAALRILGHWLHESGCTRCLV